MAFERQTSQNRIQPVAVARTWCKEEVAVLEVEHLKILMGTIGQVYKNRADVISDRTLHPASLVLRLGG